MAIPENRKTFKIGDKTYLYDDFANFYNTYKLSYYDYARERGGFSQELINQLDAEIANALDLAINSGEFDTTGDFNGNNVQNITVIKKRLGKDKEIQQGLTGRNSWLTNFIAKAGQHMNEYTEDKPNLDFNNYTLGAWLKGRGQNAELMFSDYDKAPNKDVIDGREFNERGELSYNILKGYRDFLKPIKFDFTGDKNPYNDDYMDVLNKAIEMFEKDGTYTFDKNKFDVRKLTLYLNYLGANLGGDYDYTRALTSDKYKYLTDEEKAKMDANKKAADEKADKEAEEKRLQAIENTKNEWNLEFYNFRNNNNIPESITYGVFTPQEDSFIEHYRNISDESWPYQKYGTKINLDDIGSYWNLFTESLRNQSDKADNNNYDSGTYTNQKALLLLMYENPKVNPLVFVNLGNNYHYIKDTVNDLGWGAVYNPINGSVKYVFLGDYYDNPNIKPIYDEIRSNYLKKVYPDKYSEIFPQTPPGFKKGGFIKKYLSGDPIDFSSFSSDYYLKQKAKENNRTVKQLLQLDKPINPKYKSLANPDAGLTSAEKARLALAVSDLTTALASFAPGIGTAVSTIGGITSSLGNFGVDLFDKSVTIGEAFKNLGINAGMDLVGMIPIGGAFSKFTKIIKNITPIIPSLLMLPGVVSMLKNSPEIKQSFEKLVDGKPEEGGSKMTYLDYMNILLVLNVGAGITRAGTNYYLNKKRQIPQDDKLAVSVKDKSGNNKTLLLQGDDVEKFKQRGLSFIDDMEGQGVYTLNNLNDYSFNWFKFWGKDGDDFKLFYQNPIGFTKHTIPTTSSVKFNSLLYKKDKTKNPSVREKDYYYAETRGIKPDLKGKDFIDLSDTSIEELKRLLKTDYDNIVNPHLARARSYNKRTQEYKKKLQDIDYELRQRNDNLEFIDRTINSNQQQLEYNWKRLEEIDTFNNSQEKRDLLKLIVKARRRIYELELRKLGASKEEKNALQDIIDSERKTIEDNYDKINKNSMNEYNRILNESNMLNTQNQILPVRRKEINDYITRISKIKSSINTRINTHSPSYQFLETYPGTSITRNGVTYLEKPLIDFTDLYKQGGSINRNKLNKFLNYGKR